MKIYLNKHNALLLETIKFTKEEKEWFDLEDYTIRLAGEIVPLEDKIKLVNDLYLACKEFLDEAKKP